MIEGKITINRAWRSQWKRLIVYFVLCAASIFLSSYFPQSIITGKLFLVAGKNFYLTLPLFSLLPLYGLMNLVFPIYDANFTVDNRGMETRIGIISLRQSIVRVRYEDIRSIELNQTLLERGLNIGALAIGSAATSGIEIYFDGIASPKELQALIQQERDLRIRKSSSTEQKLQAAL
ncbi:MAG: PH domain-containing protein [bacterium]|nr:PH domain-containing protein [bacterium]